MRTSERSEKLAGVVRELLPQLIAPHLNPALHGIVTVERIEVSGDLGIIKAYLTRFGGTEPFMGVIRKAKKQILKSICQRVNLRRVPELRIAQLSE